MDRAVGRTQLTVAATTNIIKMIILNGSNNALKSHYYTKIK
jgi:hypothetical protein